MRVAAVCEGAMAESTETGRPVKVLTVREVSAYLRVHPYTISRLLRQNMIPAFRIVIDWRFNMEAIDRWRAAQEETGSSLEQISTGARRQKSRRAK